MANRSEQLSRLVLHGYKSIADCDIEFKPLNVLIGSNGVGKSNLISFFHLINRILNQQLQVEIGLLGGPDALLYFGRKKTEELRSKLYFGNNGYHFVLRPTQDNRMMFSHETLWWNLHGDFHPALGHFETAYKERSNHGQVWEYTVPSMRSWRIFHFHDTSRNARIKQVQNINDNDSLREDARNLAAFLLRLKNQHNEYYQRIVAAVRLAAPFFGDFYLRPTPGNSEKIQLEWTEYGQDEPFSASALSDGTLRFICLATVLLQPALFMPTLRECIFDIMGEKW